MRWDNAILKRDASWFASAAARAIADNVIRHQSPEGGWPKNTDLAVPPSAAAGVPPSNLANSIDNDGTTLPMQFLARVIHASPPAARESRYINSFNRGFDYLLAAQYPNGGWPQIYPLRKGYWSHITFNDDAMIRVVRLMRDAAAARPPFAFVDSRRRASASAAVSRATGLILKTQVLQGGRRTAWAAQYDELSLAPAKARNFEPAALSANESVGIVRYLMDIEHPSPEVIAAVEAAVRWFDGAKIKGMRLEDFTDGAGRPDRRLVPDPSAPPLWARFYDLATNRPIYASRDSVIHHDYGAIERERRVGYAYIGTWPAELLARDYPAWRKRLALTTR